MISGFYTPEPNPTLITTPQQRCTVSMREKERKYGDRCVQIEKGTYNGLVFSTTGGMGPQSTMFLKRVATLLAAKTSQDKSLIKVK